MGVVAERKGADGRVVAWAADKVGAVVLAPVLCGWCWRRSWLEVDGEGLVRDPPSPKSPLTKLSMSRKLEAFPFSLFLWSAAGVVNYGCIRRNRNTGG